MWGGMTAFDRTKNQWGLTAAKELFTHRVLEKGNNLTDAYFADHPAITRAAAASMGTKWSKEPAVKARLAMLRQEMMDRIEISSEWAKLKRLLIVEVALGEKPNPVTKRFSYDPEMALKALAALAGQFGWDKAGESGPRPPTQILVVYDKAPESIAGTVKVIDARRNP